jgi:hypothetical protein
MGAERPKGKGRGCSFVPSWKAAQTTPNGVRFFFCREKEAKAQARKQVLSFLGTIFLGPYFCILLIFQLGEGAIYKALNERRRHHL